jgi:lambda repressor-like predicted transcriptional regulator
MPEYNAAARPRNVGWPLAASDTQRDTVLKLRKRGLALRALGEETNLGVNAVRTIIDQRDAATAPESRIWNASATT